MTYIVPATEIETIVGVGRHESDHYGRAVSAEQVFYILHSRQCFTSTNDLRECEYSKALDRGIELALWEDHQDHAVKLRIQREQLVP